MARRTGSRSASSAPRWKPEEKHRLLLEVSEAVNARLDLSGVLEEVARSLKPIVPVDGVSIVTVEENSLRPHAVHIEGVEHRRGDSFADVVARSLAVPTDAFSATFKPLPMSGSATEHVGRTGKAYVCQDLRNNRRFVEDERLLSLGIASYVRTPLFARERLIGSMTFVRMRRLPFAAEDVTILEEVSRPIAAAVANSLAYEEIARLKNRLEEENLVLREELDERSMFEEIIGSSGALRQVLARVERVARTDSTVLITGETGTGKELIAHAIHRRSRRESRSLITVNCAALPETLIASELFGHEKGAFTGALQRRMGRFELASGGSIFLDEVGELPAEIQVALLRVLQEGEFERVGGTQTLRTDARVIAATNRDLSAAVSAGEFRQDLFYRLNVFPIDVPPLRERRQDIPILVEYFTRRYAARIGKRFQAIEKKAMDFLLSYAWPGNVRELQNVIERAAILSDGDTLRVEESALAPGPRLAEAGGSLVAGVEEHERQIIESVLAQTQGRISGPSGAAVRLGVASTTLESKIRRLGIDKHRYRSLRTSRVLTKNSKFTTYR
jgi:formate hydrogenlyase transcriptional activator